MTGDLAAIVGVAGAALGGAAVGFEREWSGHASGPHAHFAGIRTFTLLGALAGLAGWMWGAGYQAFALALVAGGAALVVAGYVAASRREIDGTTEVAALVVLAAGVLAGTGHLALASGVIAVTNLLLVEKTRLHAIVARVQGVGLRAGIRFAVMAVVILPLLPEGPYGPLGGVRPRELWMLVLLFSGLSFSGYIARGVLGPRHGYPAAGLIGGFISSTSVTLMFARASATRAAAATALACGVTAACAIMFVRVVLATAILQAPLAIAVVPYVVAPFVVGAVLAALLLRGGGEDARTIAAPANPLAFWTALQMAAMFQLVLFGVAAVRARWGGTGLLVSGALLGVADVDALTISMARSVSTGSSTAIAAQALALGTLANGLLKLALALALGRGTFRRVAALALAAIAVVSAASILILR